MTNFPKNLKEIRVDNKISQETLAKAMGVNQRTISSWEQGIRQPDYDMLIKLADYFGVSTDTLLT